MENVGSTQVCVTLDSTPASEVNVTLETDDTPSGAQGKLFYSSACKKASADYSPLVHDTYGIFSLRICREAQEVQNRSAWKHILNV